MEDDNIKRWAVFKTGGHAVFIAGVILSSVYAAQDGISWTRFLLSAASAAAGAVLVRRGRRGRGGVKITGGGKFRPESFFQASLTGIINDIRELIYSYREKSIGDMELKRGIENVQTAVMLFVENRDFIGSLYGLKGEADIMTGFSSGERRVSRSWSELVDAYADDAIADLEESVGYFSDTLKLLKEMPPVSDL